MKKITLLVLAMFFCLTSLSLAGTRRQGEMPAPRLMAPGDVAELGDKGVEFRWGNESGGNFDHYDFRLYRGTQTYEKNLILQKDIPAGKSSLTIDTANFSVGQSYAWSLRYMGARKSDSSYSIFKVKNRA